jgi:membrane protease YdiL (CAAX protease family)
MEPREHNPKFPRFWQAVGIIVLLLIVEIAASIALIEMGVALTLGDPRGYIVTVLVTGIGLSLILAHKKLDYRRLFSPGNGSFEATMRPIFPSLLVLCAGVFVLIMEFSNFTARFLPPSPETQEGLVQLLMGGLPSILTICVIAPVIEEMFFRGILLRGFLHNYPPWTAILLASLLFGLRHLDPGHAIVATVTGVVLGWLYYATRSLWPAVFAHALQNGAVMLFVKLAPETAEATVGVPAAFPLLPIPVLLAAVLAVFYGVRRISAASRPPPAQG